MKVSPFIGVVTDFLKKTTLHGFKYLGSRYYIDRLVWVLVCCASACSAGVLCAVLWARFMQRPAIVALRDLKDLSVASKDMPTIVLCLPADQIAANVVTLFKSVNNETWLISTLEHVIQKKMADENHLKMLDKHLDELGMALPDALIKYSPECQDIVTSCRWQNHMLPCRRLFRKQFTDWGLCCVLDPVRLQKKHTRRLFDHLETTRRLDIGLTCRNASTDIHGCELLTVYNGDVNIVPQVLQQGSSYWFRMTFTVTLDNGGSLLDMNRGCESENRYSKLVCMAKCLKQTCGCSDPLKTVSGEEEQLPYCRISQLNCLRSTKTFENSSCLCLPSCSKISVDTSMETNNILMDYNFDPLYGLNSSISNVVYIEVRLQESKVFFLLPTETWLTLLSSFGGVFNMFLGVGLFSALEFLFLIIKLLLALRKSAEIHIPETHYH